MAATYSNVIWVSPSGSDRNSGSEDAPLATIQQAVKLAVPGTSILVREGTYVENVKIAPSVNIKLFSTSEGKGLEIISVDGPGAAKIVGADQSGLVPTVYAIATSYLTIDGFEIESNVLRALGANDGGPLKIIGNQDFSKPTTDVVIENNTFTGTGVSMIKLAQMKGVTIENNTFEGTASQNFVDMVSCWDLVIADNDFVGQAWLGVTMKTGSHNITVEHNYFDFVNLPGQETQTAVLVGGVSYSQLERELLPEEFHSEASDIRVLENVIVSASDYGVMFQGGINSVVSGNVIANTGGVAFKSTVSPSPEPHGGNSAENTITDNTLVNIRTVHEVYGTASGYDLSGNVTGKLSDADFEFGRDSAPVVPDPVQPGPVVPGPDALTLTIHAAGTGSGTAAPTFSVIVDGETVGTFTIGNPGSTAASSPFSDYSVQLDGGVPSRVQVSFVNDGTTDGVDRNLFIDYIELGGTIYQSEQDGWFTPVNGIATFAGARESLYVNGVLTFDLPAAPVVPRNTPPTLDMAASVSGDEGTRIELGIVAGDADGPMPTVSLTLTRDSDGSVVDPSSYSFTVGADGKGLFAWNTGEAHDGRYTVVVTAHDGVDTVTRSASLTVREVAQAPELTVPGAMRVAEGSTATFTVRATDADGDMPDLVMVLADRDTGAIVDPSHYSFIDNADGTARFTWLTGEPDDGRYRATVTASDGGLSTSRTVDLTVDEVPTLLTIRAGGRGTATAAPQFEVFADGVSLGVHKIGGAISGKFDLNNDSLYRDYSFSLNGVDPDSIRIVYRNDGTTGGVNRDLFVDYISIDGRTYESETDGWFTTSNAGNQASLGGARESLFVNGTLTFDQLQDDFLF